MPVHLRIWLRQTAGCAPIAQQRGEPRSGTGGGSRHAEAVSLNSQLRWALKTAFG